MNDFLYPIKIKKWPQSILFEEYHVFQTNKFKLSDLNFVGDDSFTFEPTKSLLDASSGCLLTVAKTRLETDLEMAARVAKEETYMEEYNKRNNKSS
jgi:hypothetical protein